MKLTTALISTGTLLIPHAAELVGGDTGRFANRVRITNLHIGAFASAFEQTATAISFGQEIASTPHVV